MLIKNDGKYKHLDSLTTSSNTRYNFCLLKKSTDVRVTSYLVRRTVQQETIITTISAIKGT